ncbi:lipid-A-disaccharide synthase [Aquabacter spiritensis]|uniref:Lipid-A-disaccharide synthase n=1 Tax=Aquabacter spiritensis TaxID=933073 RepID=A0A4R3LWH7_9HYPH|nr:lipid-A-disaccharide synthase [Aquabacter spiritensis]TCT02887.1 lipid-A-disaccharide synthase [Aquabacter spiritensis]
MGAPANRPLRVFVVAGEESGDQLGGALMEALADLAPAGATFSGVGGRRMEAAGLQSLFPMDDLTAIGFGQVVGKLPTILRRLRETVTAIVKERPDVLVLVDAPDFTHRVAARVRRLAPDIPIAKYVSPTVWAWRPGRARAMRPSIDRILALLPFEPQVHERLGGPPTFYVGHPLLERLGDLRPAAAESGRRSARPYRIVVLPGSRRSEVERLGDVFGTALGQIAEARDAEFVLPTLPRLLPMVEALVSHWPVPVRVVTAEADRMTAFRTARAALAASGTVTLELALAGVPLVAAYKVAGWEAKIAPYILTIPSVILPNLVLGENVVPEFLQHDCTPAKLAHALDEVIAEGPKRRRQIEAFARLDDVFGTTGPVPSERAAAAVLDMIAHGSPERASAQADVRA